MDWQGWFTIFITASTLVTLMATRLSPDLVLMGALSVLLFSGILDADLALAGFSNSGLITVAAMFVVAAGIRASGGVDLVVHNLLGRPRSVRGALARLTLPVASLSGFLNNTPVVATMIPAVTRWARQIGIPSSRLMIPLSYASILGGCVTLIGTSTNLVVNGQYQALTGEPALGLFTITGVGLAVAAVGLLILLLVSPILLPERRSPDETFADKRSFTFEVAVAHDGPLVGKNIVEAGLRHLKRIYLVEIERNGGILTAVTPEERLHGGDRLVFVGDTEAIVDVLRIPGLVASVGKQPVIERNAPERRLVEAVVSPNCEGIGKTIKDGRFRDRYGAVVLAVARNGEHVKGRLSSIVLEPGDVLLLEARPAFVSRQRFSRDFLLISELDEERPDHSRALVSWAILSALVLLASTGITSMLEAALLGAGAMVASRCVSLADAKRSLDLTVLITIAASFSLGNALQATGAADYLGESLLTLSGGHPWLLLLLTFVAVSVLTEMVTNNAAALIMLPIVLAVTESLGLNAVPYVITVMLAASASFATPLGYQTNLMVYGPGGYHFSDFLRMGLLMNFSVGVTTVLVVPLIWPLQ
ncbi:MAG: SLC13 family permease [Alcanivoracaceae bacterium]|jgi:di/tricarboxylate transporter|nr:SLC13 family permease [Alcanivoracaceae bacterium]